ncbi:MAG: hypothetical protein HFF88_01455, partial [Oscillibacter sp.]|nr:hypothetical protein [Oscillibacter sp.]
GGTFGGAFGASRYGASRAYGGYTGGRPAASAYGGESAPVTRTTFRDTPSRRPAAGTASSAPAALELAVGDRVEHKAYGLGAVVLVEPKGRDVWVKVDFETKGVLKLQLKAVSSHMKKIEG